MTDYTDRLRAAARRLLGEGRVDCFIGYRRGSLPLAAQPAILTRAEQADSLIWDPSCGMNLAHYAVGRADRIGIVATGCVSRSLVALALENQVARERLHIVGVPCTGMLDAGALRRRFPGREAAAAAYEGPRVTIAFADGNEELAVAENLARPCRTCAHPNPVVADEMLGEPVASPAVPAVPEEAAAAEARSAAERWAYFCEAFAHCIRCYACRNACPLCYCPTCFVDESRPQWVGKSSDPTDTRTFHFLRALHLAGRCTDCGACERACPLDIPVRHLTSRLNAEAKAIYGFEAGLDLEERPLLDRYRPEDLNDFFK